MKAPIFRGFLLVTILDTYGFYLYLYTMKFKDIIKDILIAESEGPSEHAKWVAKQVLVKFMFADYKEQRGFVWDYDLDVSGVSNFVLSAGGAEDYYLQYNFEIDISSYPSYTPATYDDPGDYDPAEYEIEIKQITVFDNDQIIYEGPDFTNFASLKIGEVESRYGQNRISYGEGFLYDYFGDKIEEILSDNAD
jgi:hypothetical protein